MFSLGSGADIGPGKIIAFEQQRNAAALGQSVGGTVPEIERRRMPPFAVAQERLPGGQRQGMILRDHRHRRMCDEVIEVSPAGSVACPASQNHARFKEGNRREKTVIRRGNDFEKPIRLDLPHDYRDERRAVDDDHAGRPFSS